MIAGAEHPLGRSLAKRLAGFGASVIALGRHDAPLMRLAAEFPERIEPLALPLGRKDLLPLLKEAWGDEPIHFFIDMLALYPFKAREPVSVALGRSAGVFSALSGGLRAGSAQAVMLLPKIADSDSPERQANAAGYEAFLVRVAAACPPGRMTGLRLPCDPKFWTERRCVSAGDVVLMLCHPISRGLKPASVLDWAG